METGPLPKSTAVSIVGHGGKGYTWLVSSGVPSPLKEESQLRERRTEYDPFSNLCVERKMVLECIACFALGLVVNSNGGTSVGFQVGRFTIENCLAQIQTLPEHSKFSVALIWPKTIGYCEKTERMLWWFVFDVCGLPCAWV